MKVDSIISFFANLVIPINLTAILLIIAVILLLAKLNKTAFCLATIAIVWVIAWSLPATSVVTGSVLEQLHPNQTDNSSPNKHYKAIVVLGGNTANSRSNWFEPPRKETAVLRSDTAIKLYKRDLSKLIIISGASLDGGISEAGIMANKMKLLGVNDKDIIQENNSKTTHQNAVYTAEILQEQNIHQFLLVTSALHMPRSFASFKKLGFEPVSAATPPQIFYPTNKHLNPWLPDLRSLNASRTIIKEYLAITVYWLRGWI